MKVLVDTSVWSLALRRSGNDRQSGHSKTTDRLADLILSSLVVVIGPVRQELLSGIPDERVFLKLKTKLKAFDDLAITTSDYETAAQFYNTCRKNGVQGSHTDFLICAAAFNNNLQIFTTDKDYLCFAEYLPIRLLE
ncbi:MAG: PIN domain-containing protein [Clostridiales bacterium]|nr:PIN domain-containing protein [Clostridiales bacterium]